MDQEKEESRLDPLISQNAPVNALQNHYERLVAFSLLCLACCFPSMVPLIVVSVSVGLRCVVWKFLEDDDMVNGGSLATRALTLYRSSGQQNLGKVPVWVYIHDPRFFIHRRTALALFRSAVAVLFIAAAGVSVRNPSLPTNMTSYGASHLATHMESVGRPVVDAVQLLWSLSSQSLLPDETDNVSRITNTHITRQYTCYDGSSLGIFHCYVSDGILDLETITLTAKDFKWKLEDNVRIDAARSKGGHMQPKTELLSDGDEADLVSVTNSGKVDNVPTEQGVRGNRGNDSGELDGLNDEENKQSSTNSGKADNALNGQGSGGKGRNDSDEIDDLNDEENFGPPTNTGKVETKLVVVEEEELFAAHPPTSTGLISNKFNIIEDEAACTVDAPNSTGKVENKLGVAEDDQSRPTTHSPTE
ncbi:hypothetical protein BJ508DRAFT_330236 [Ascobolus immersus RN42]|uniref:Uncharacterized protein n=1 Tax=Ascobolus immersus RN42 TaxID=1160509 RepID=A0A3N4HU42_ASCIM|nr:hypothetical protein BJ508DRAFT_330236 [Ascobolus immersus RN42]